MIATNGDIHIYLPEHRNNASIIQLELLKQHQLKKTEIDKFAVFWLESCCTPTTFANLLKTSNSDSLADIAQTATQAILKSTQPYTQPPYKKIHLKTQQLHAPEPYLANITFGQFIAAEEQLFLYMLNQNSKHIANLANILYRPETEKHYTNNEQSQITAQEIAKTLKPHQLHLILDYYIGSRTIIEQNNPQVFPAPQPKATKPSLTAQKILDMVKSYHAKLVQYAGTPDRKKHMYNESAWTVLEFINTDIQNYKIQEKNQRTTKQK